MKIFHVYWELLGTFRRRALACIGVAVASGLLEGLALIALGPIIQGGVDPSRNNTPSTPGPWFTFGLSLSLQAQIGVFFVLGLLSAAARFSAEGLMISLRLKVEEMTRRETGLALLNMNWPKFIGLRLGDVSVAILNEGAQIGNATYVFLNAIATGVVALALAMAALVLSMEMTAYTALFGIVGLTLFRLSAGPTKRHAEALSKIAFEIGDITTTTFGNLKFLRATGLGTSTLAGTFQAYQRFARASFLSGIYGPLMRFGLEIGAVLMVGGFFLLVLGLRHGSASTMLVFLFIFYRLVPRLLAMQDSLHQCRILLPWYSAWKDRLLLARSFQNLQGGQACIRFEDSITFNNVQFAYPESDSPVIQGFSLGITRGECIAIVGPSGSGKSTLIDLVTGLLTPTMGAITVDTIPMVALDLDCWQQQLGLVLQESPVFHTTVLENITWGSGAPDLDKAERSARMAHAWEFIEALPQKMASVVGEKGGRLSGGQRQRLALARALYREPSLLILDEATSALDGAAETEVQKALESIKGSCSILMVAHRIKTVQIADRIIVLENGQISESGTWDDLISKPDGTFRRMAEAQGVNR